MNQLHSRVANKNGPVKKTAINYKEKLEKLGLKHRKKGAYVRIALLSKICVHMLSGFATEEAKCSYIFKYALYKA